MTNIELYRHYHKRSRLCRNIINDIPDRNHNPKWNSFLNLFRYYDYRLRLIENREGRSTAGGGNYKSQFEEAIKPESRNLGNYESKS